MVAIGGNAIYPDGYHATVRCHGTRVMVDWTRSAYSKHLGVNETGGALLVESKMGLAIACTYSCSRANLKDRIGDPLPHPIDTRDCYEAASLF